MTVKPYLLVLCAVLLSACERSEEPKPAAENVVENTLEQPVETPVADAVEPEQAPQAPEPKPAVKEPAPRPAKPVLKAKAPEPVAPALSLDLSVPKSLLKETNPVALGDEPAPLLPQLFNKKGEISPYEISGRLLNNEAEENYFDSVEGAELKIEFRQ